jgi:hypothetical protein
MAILWREKKGIHVVPAEGNFVKWKNCYKNH